MRFIVDENTGPIVAAWLQSMGHSVLSIYDELRGSDDNSIIHKANDENYIIITNDKDFGEKVFLLCTEINEKLCNVYVAQLKSDMLN
jgi:predicted nuclease of predicted toxin-antitoxin system